jgi:hypothetical protein
MLTKLSTYRLTDSIQYFETLRMLQLPPAFINFNVASNFNLFLSIILFLHSIISQVIDSISSFHYLIDVPIDFIRPSIHSFMRLAFSANLSLISFLYFNYYFNHYHCDCVKAKKFLINEVMNVIIFFISSPQVILYVVILFCFLNVDDLPHPDANFFKINPH